MDPTWRTIGQKPNMKAWLLGHIRPKAQIERPNVTIIWVEDKALTYFSTSLLTLHIVKSLFHEYGWTYKKIIIG